MQKLVLLLVLLFQATAGAADTHLPALPTVVTLKNGAIIRNVSVVRFEPGRVILKHAGGVAPFRYEHLSEADRSAFLAHAEAEKEKASRPVPKQKYSGQVYVQTVGAGPYVFSGVKVRVFAKDQLARMREDEEATLERPVVTVLTDAEGRFEFELPQGQEGFVFAQTYRHVFRGATRQTEKYDWILPLEAVDDPSRLLLSHRNQSPVNYTVVVKE